MYISELKKDYSEVKGRKDPKIAPLQCKQNRARQNRIHISKDMDS